MAKTSNSRSDSPLPAPRRRGRRILHYALLAISGVLIIDALFGDRGLVATLRARQQYRSLEQALANSRADNSRLREDARRLREDPAAIEDLARRELGLIKPGEKLFIVKDIDSPHK